jgi:hypothetical protein
MVSPETAGCSARAKAQSIRWAQSIHRARFRPVVSVRALLLVFAFVEQFLAAWSDLFAEFPEAPLDSESAFGFRESGPDLVASLDRQGRASVVALPAFAAGLERVQRLRQRTRWMPEPPA